MLDADFDRTDLYHELMHALDSPPPAAVERIRLDDETISPALRGLSSELAYAAAAVELPRSWRQLLLGAAQREIAAELRQLASEIEDPALREYYLAPQRTLRELGAVVGLVSSESRVRFISSLLAAERDEAVRAYVADKIDNALQHVTHGERLELIERAGAIGDRTIRDRALARLLASAGTLAELTSLIDSAGSARLVERGGAETRELLAHAELGTALRRVELPDANASGDAEQIFAGLERALGEMERIARSVPAFRDTEFVRDLLHTVRSAKADLAADRAAAQSPEELLETARIYTEIVSLNARYGVSITYGDSDYLNRHADHHGEGCCPHHGRDGAAQEEPAAGRAARWRLQDLADVRDVLERIPEGHLLFADYLRDIQLVDSLGYGVLGARYHADGVIKIARSAIGNHLLSWYYDGESSLAIVLAHEIGHGVQIGDGPAGISFGGPAGPHFHGGEEMYDFDEYLALSGWTVYDRSRFAPSEQPGFIVLDGKEVALETPVDVGGRTVVLQYYPGWGLLTSYDADAEFSFRAYSRSSPWEDFAEAFAEYLFLPERLAAMAPYKFRHLDEEFGRYRNDERIQEVLRKAIEARETAGLADANPAFFVAIREQRAEEPWVL